MLRSLKAIVLSVSLLCSFNPANACGMGVFDILIIPYIPLILVGAGFECTASAVRHVKAKMKRPFEKMDLERQLAHFFTTPTGPEKTITTPDHWLKWFGKMIKWKREEDLQVVTKMLDDIINEKYVAEFASLTAEDMAYVDEEFVKIFETISFMNFVRGKTGALQITSKQAQQYREEYSLKFFDEVEGKAIKKKLIHHGEGVYPSKNIVNG